MRIIFLLIVSLMLFSCINTKNIEQNEHITTITNNDNNKNSNDRILVYLDSVPPGAYVFFEDGRFFTTPAQFNLEKKEYKFKIERLRYYSEELVIDVNQINKTNNNSIQVKLKRNPAFTKDYYLSGSLYVQADGVSKEHSRYIYDENAKPIRIDNYIHNSYDGCYNITLDDNGNILTKQIVNISGEASEAIEHFEYNNKNQLIKSWYTGLSDDRKWDKEYFYKDGVLEKVVIQSNNGTLIFDFIVETKYGSINSAYTKIITEKNFNPNSTEEKRKKDLEDDYLARTIYGYQ
jgi:hypothetical protein